MKLIKEKLSGSEAVFGFAGWLTTRDEPTIMSASHEAGNIAKLVGEFLDKQELEDPIDHWEDELVSMYEWLKIPLNENKEWSESFKNIKDKIKKSKSLSKDIKEEVLKRIITSKHGTRYNKGVVTKLKGSPGRGCSLGADKNGWFVFTHRARSKSKPSINKITKKEIKFIESTG